jgi:hypothetical protein
LRQYRSGAGRLRALIDLRRAGSHPGLDLIHALELGLLFLPVALLTSSLLARLKSISRIGPVLPGPGIGSAAIEDWIGQGYCHCIPSPDAVHCSVLRPDHKPMVLCRLSLILWRR